MATYKHGVYVSEVATRITPPITGSAGLQVVFGTAPINMAADPYAATNVPILAYSYAEAVNALGYVEDFEHYTLCQSIDLSFRVIGVAPVVFINVLDPAKHKKTIPAAQVSVLSGVARVAMTGLLPDTVKVAADAESATVYQAGTDYLLSFDNDGALLVTLVPTGAAGAANTLYVSGTAIDPTMVTAADVIGGINVSTGAETGLELVRHIYPKFGLTPGLLLAPGWSHLPEVAAVMQGKTTGINGVFQCNTLIDVDCGADGAQKYTDVKQVKEDTGLTNVNAYPLWPMAKIGAKKYRYSAFMGAEIQYIDANNGDIPNIRLSNKTTSLTCACLEDGTEVLLDQEQANLVNSFGVTTLLNLNGWRTWGNNTAAYPGTTDPKDRWFAVRRFFNWWRNSFVLTYFQKVDDPANYRLIENITDSENIRGNGYVARGICARAEIQFLEDENPATDILNGTIRFHQFLSPYVPAECIENTLEFDPNALQSALAGGEA